MRRSKSRQWHLTVIAICILAFAAPLTGVSAPRIKFTRIRLNNGLHVIISEDHRAPVISLTVMYDVGDRNERPGHTGLAHLFEHMMFEGSAHVGPGEHLRLLNINGGRINGNVTKERSLYHQTLPSNQLELGLFLEADRMGSLEISQRSLEVAKKAVREEIRQRRENQMWSATFDALTELTYDSFAYKHSASVADLENLTVQDALDFFRAYYAPNNAVLAIVGDVSRAEALTKARQYFEPIPSRPLPPSVRIEELPQQAERRRTLDDQFATVPHIDITYKVPSAASPDNAPLGFLGDILGQGRSSRLFELLVRQTSLASEVAAGPAAGRDTG